MKGPSALYFATPQLLLRKPLPLPADLWQFESAIYRPVSVREENEIMKVQIVLGGEGVADINVQMINKHPGIG